MRQVGTLLLILLLTGHHSANAQQRKKQSLLSYLKSADSVIILSHRYVDELMPYGPDSNGRFTHLPGIVSGGRLNDTIVLERRRLGSSTLIELAGILTYDNPKTPNETKGCFLPRHSLLVYKDSAFAYLDLCFSCQNYQGTRILQDYMELTSESWDRLKQFFRRQGVRQGFEKH